LKHLWQRIEPPLPETMCWRIFPNVDARSSPPPMTIPWPRMSSPILAELDVIDITRLGTLSSLKAKVARRNLPQCRTMTNRSWFLPDPKGSWQ